MSRQLGLFILLSGLVPVGAVLSGCCPSQPFYLCESADLSHYLETATQIEYPDVHEPMLDEVTSAQPPFTISDPFASGHFWDLTLEEAVSIALQNSKIIRRVDSVGDRLVTSDILLRAPESVTTLYDPALVESNPVTGVEAALAEFDAQLTTSLFWDQVDRPQNLRTAIPGFTRALRQDRASFQAELAKKAATGTELFFRQTTDYENSNVFGSSQALNSFWTTALELEVRQPLLRGRGTQVNRIPVIIARINHDISLADFEADVRNLVMDLERAYWDLQCQYRILDANKRARDLALETWRDIEAELRQAGDEQPGRISFQGGARTAEDELRARGQYYSFRAQVETNLRQLYDAENRLRWLMGLASTDGRLLRPVDEPTTSKITFDWNEIHCEALVRTPELRRQKWVIQQREMELIAARNQLLPDLNVTALYRWLGLGDTLITANRNGLNFPDVGSTAWESLTEGNFQEFRFGLELGLPIGFRKELAGVRNAQLGLARDRARLEEMELNVSHLLTRAVRDMDGLLVVAQTYFNSWAASRSEVQALLEKRRAGEDIDIDFILRAFQRAVAAEIAYHQAICNYNAAIAQVHFRKGSLLEYNNIYLAEGPWPQKAYWDALGHARRRSASRYLNFGWSRPRVISRGPVPQQTGTATGFLVIPRDQLPVPRSAPAEPPPEELPPPIPETAETASADPEPMRPVDFVEAETQPPADGRAPAGRAARGRPLSDMIGWVPAASHAASAGVPDPDGTIRPTSVAAPAPVSTATPTAGRISRPADTNGDMLTNPLRPSQ